METGGRPVNPSPLARRKARDRALILPLVGLLLLMPPLAGIFQLEARIAGVPFTAIYLFVIWGALIAGAALLSGHLRRELESVPQLNQNAERRE